MSKSNLNVLIPHIFPPLSHPYNPLERPSRPTCAAQSTSTMSLSAISRKTASLSLSAPQIHTDPTPATITSLPSSSLPIPTYNLTRTLAGVQTDLLIQNYEDRVFVMITQLGRMGFLVRRFLGLVSIQRFTDRPAGSNADTSDPLPTLTSPEPCTSASTQHQLSTWYLDLLISNPDPANVTPTAPLDPLDPAPRDPPRS